MGEGIESFLSLNHEVALGLVFVLGCVIGSFLNVCIYRIPRNETVVSTPSHCPICNTKISWYDNLPLLSYLFLSGKCRNCSTRISPRYPMVEGLTGILFLLIYIRFGPSLETIAYSLFAALLLISTFTDLERDDEGELYMMIPDLVTVPGTVAGVLFSIALTDMKLIESLLGVVVGGGALYLVMRIAPMFMRRGEPELENVGEGNTKQGVMGEGDTKLAAMMGAFLGWEKVLIGIYLGIIIGAVVGLILLVLKIKGRKDAVPFGPFLAIGAFLAMFYGAQIISFIFDFSVINP